MLAGMSSRQLAEWQAFWRVEPFGELREDWRWACLLATLANMMRGEKQEPVGPQNFLPVLDPTGESEPPLTPSERAAAAFEEQWRAMVGE